MECRGGSGYAGCDQFRSSGGGGWGVGDNNDARWLPDRALWQRFLVLLGRLFDRLRKPLSTGGEVTELVAVSELRPVLDTDSRQQYCRSHGHLHLQQLSATLTFLARWVCAVSLTWCVPWTLGAFAFPGVFDFPEIFGWREWLMACRVASRLPG